MLSRADACAWLSAFDAESFDCVITDPPYESLEKHRAVGTTTRLKHSKASSNDWFTIFPNSRFEELFRQVYRTLKRNAHFYLFVDLDTLFVAKPIAEAAGFKFWNAIVWDKMKMGMGYHYRRRKEFILFFEKGRRKLNDLGVPDVLNVGLDADVDIDADDSGSGRRGIDWISCPRIANGYPTEKPVAVSEILIRQSTLEGETVADPFMGSGSVGVAALKCRRKFLGCDISEKALDVAEKRLQEVCP